MADRDSPVGRKKRIGGSSGSIRKRGDGLNGRTGGPVGDSGGYADRKEGTPSRRTGGLSTLLGGSSSGGGTAGGGATGGAGTPPGGGRVPSLGCSPKLLLALIVIVAIVVVVLYLLFRGSGGTADQTSEAPTGGFQTTTSAAPSANTGQTDPDAYSVVTAVSQGARDKYTVLRGGSADTATVMVYMCGTDLESRSGMATADLQEMLYAEISDKVNIIVETGGTARWQNNVISSTTNQRYRLTGQGLEPLEQNLGKRPMVDPATLADFIRYSKAEYPADRYLLILWDHGGGSVSGYGYDQLFSRDSMALDEVATALRNGGCTFDVVGFDACLMATLETAIVLEPYADYMIASEEVEPGIGWYYTGWVTALSQNTSIATTDLGKRLIDDYVRDVQAKTPRSQATLSLIDLAELKGTVPSAFTAFARSTSSLIDTEQYQVVSDARDGAKEFSPSSQINQIDLIHFADDLGTSEAKALADALRSCIKYNRTSSNIANANGVSIFFPSGRLSQLDSMLATYDQIGIADEYSDCVRSYASVAAGGQIVSSGSGNMLDVLLGGLSGGGSEGPQPAPPAAPSGGGVAGGLGALLEAFLAKGDFSSITGRAGAAPNWLDVDRMESSLDFYADNQFDQSILVITEKGGQRVLALPEEQWDLVQDLELNVFIDDGEGFIDLGLDNVYEYSADGDLVMEYDGTWLALNGRIVSYYMMTDDRSGDSYTITGRVPALLNDQVVDIILVFDDQDPDGTVLGARIRYDAATQTETVAKGLLEILPGDTIDFLCDYYTYDGDYSDTYFLGDQYIATGQWEIENLYLGDEPYQMTYRLTDIYGNKYWTPSVTDGR